MNSLEIQSLINAKEKRQFILEERKKTILEIDDAINESSFNLNMQGYYYFIKRFILIIFSLGFLILSIILLLSPETLFGKKMKEEMKKEFKQEYINENSSSVAFILTDLSNNIFINKNNYSDADQIEIQIKDSVVNLMDKKAEEDFNFSGKVLGFALLFLALLLYYIARLTKKLKERNDLILKSDELAKIVIEDYNKTLEEEKIELISLKKAYLSNTHI